MMALKNRQDDSAATNDQKRKLSLSIIIFVWQQKNIRFDWIAFMNDLIYLVEMNEIYQYGNCKVK